MASGSAQRQMVSQQIRAWDVLEPRVLDVMSLVDRAAFTPEAFRGVAYADTRIPIGHDQEMLSPKIVGRLLQALNLLPSDSVLEVGTGTGYVTACLARLGGHVLSLDIFQELVETARANLEPLGLAGLTLETRDAMTLDERGRFDAIAVTGSLPDYDPRFEQALTIGGRLFVIVGGEPIMDAVLVTRVADEEWVRESLFETVVPPLLHADKPAEFVF